MSSEIINDLVRKAKNGNVEAFGILYETYSKDMYKFALYYMGHPQLAEDCVSECVLSAFKNIKALKKPEAFKGWLFKILYNCCNKALKEKILSKDNVELSSVSDLGTNEDNKEDIIALRMALEKLSEKERTIILLSYTAGYSSKEISKIIGINASTVRTIIMRGTEKLRKLLHTNEVIK